METVGVDAASICYYWQKDSLDGLFPETVYAWTVTYLRTSLDFE